MTLTRDQLEDQAGEYQTRLSGLRSYMTELREMLSRHGTDESLLEADLHEAEHNVRYYEAELARVRKELGAARGGGGGTGRVEALLPLTGKQSAGAIALVSLGFAAGVLVGRLLNDRKGE